MNEEILRDAQGYSHSKGLFSARKSVMKRYQAEGVEDIQVEDVIMGTGVSELIVMSMQGLLNQGDEILLAPMTLVLPFYRVRSLGEACLAPSSN
jgi:aspartate/methionine/tyrosine aminotransferase